MPTLSASEYTNFLKFKAGAATGIKPSIQTRDNVSLSQSLINANILASQAAFVVTPTVTNVQNNARVQGQQVVQTRATSEAKSTLGYAGTSGAMSSSAVQRPGGLPTGFRGSQGTYHRIPQRAGWKSAGPPGF
jgi:hypothetical protein